MKKYIFILLFPVVCQATIVTPSLNSFNAGEVSPLMEARNDFTKYNNSCRLLRNMFVLSQGPITRRPGTKYIAEVKDSNDFAELIPFEFSKTDTYMHEYGNLYMRIYRNGGQVYDSSGSEDLSSLDNIVAHWKLNDASTDTVVLDADGATYNGVATANTILLSGAGKVNDCFDLDGTYAVEIADHANFSFDDSGSNPFSITAWVYVDGVDAMQVIASKWKEDTAREWRLSLDSARKLQLHLCDDSIDLTGSRVAQWYLNDDAANTAVDDIGGSHDGVATSNTEDLTTTGKINACFDLSRTDCVEINDNAALSFDDSGDNPFSIAAWIYVTDTGYYQTILSKWDTAAKKEWIFSLNADRTLSLTLCDMSISMYPDAKTDDALSVGWHFVVTTYDSTGGATAANGIELYVDGALAEATASNDATYVAMEDLSAKVVIGALYISGSLDHNYTFADKIDNVILFDIELTAANVLNLYNNGNGTESLAATFPNVVADDALSFGWYFVSMTYDSTGDSTATNGVVLYVDGSVVDSTATNEASYVAMEDTAIKVRIGSQYSAAAANEKFWRDKIDNVAIFSDVLTATEVASLYSTSVVEITTEYTDDEVNELQTVQIADTMYIVHPDHEPSKLTRTGHAAWTIADVNYIDGPFLDENTDTSITVTPSATTGTITLDSNSDIFSANLVGALWEIRHPRTDATVSGSLAANGSSSAIGCEGDYKFTTHGTWTATVYLEKSLDGSTWEKVSGSLISSVDDDNISYSGNESDSGYTYKVTMASRTSGTATYNFVVFDHMHTGVVRISSYVDPSEVTAVVHTTLGGTSATYYWSEGYWSPKNGYPQTIAFHEFRLWFGGSTDYPQTIWASKSGDADDYESMSEGTDDDDALIYHLPGQNPIQFLHSYDYLIIGTLGGVGRMGDIDEPMAAEIAPIYSQQTPYGSEFIQAVSAGDAVLYVGHGGDKVREFAYSLERDRFVSPDMTVLAEHITGDGIVDIAYQIRPDSVLWCVLDDGDMATMTYQRENDVFAWSLQVTEGDYESVAIIPGSEEDEIWTIVNRTVDANTVRYVEQFQPRDWGTDNTDAWFVDCGLDWDGGDAVSISGATKSNPCIITVSTWPTDGDGDNLADGDQIKILAVVGMTELNGNIYTMDDADTSAKTFTLNDSDDSADINSTGYTTYSSGGTVQRFEKDFSNLEHHEGEVVSVFADGEARSNNTVSSGAIETSNWYNKVLVGLPYTSIMETMPLVFNTQSGSTSANYTRVINVSFDFYETLGLSFGVDEDNLTTKDFDMFTGWKEYRFTYGKMRPSTIYVQTAKPVPLTIRQIVPTVEIND